MNIQYLQFERIQYTTVPNVSPGKKCTFDAGIAKNCCIQYHLTGSSASEWNSKQGPVNHDKQDNPTGDEKLGSRHWDSKQQDSRQRYRKLHLSRQETGGNLTEQDKRAWKSEVSNTTICHIKERKETVSEVRPNEHDDNISWWTHRWGELNQSSYNTKACTQEPQQLSTDSIARPIEKGASVRHFVRWFG